MPLSLPPSFFLHSRILESALLQYIYKSFLFFTSSQVTGPCTLISELSALYLLDKLTVTASGQDDLPFRFLRLAAPFIARPPAYLINLSLQSSTIPLQWKTAVIHPIPEIPNPTEP